MSERRCQGGSVDYHRERRTLCDGRRWKAGFWDGSAKDNGGVDVAW